MASGSGPVRAAVEPAQRAVLTELARTYNEIGNVRSARFEFGKAHESHRHALSVLQSVRKSRRLTEGYRYELARTWDFLASKRLGAMGSGRYGEAGGNVTGPRPHYYKSNDYRTAAVRMLEELTRAHPGDPDYRFLLGLCQRLTDVGPPAARSTTAALGRQRATTSRQRRSCPWGRSARTAAPCPGTSAAVHP